MIRETETEVVGTGNDEAALVAPQLPKTQAQDAKESLQQKLELEQQQREHRRRAQQEEVQRRKDLYMYVGPSSAWSCLCCEAVFASQTGFKRHIEKRRNDRCPETRASRRAAMRAEKRAL